MGTGDAQSSQAVPGVELVAVSDIYDGRLTRAKERWGSQLFTTRDYREVLARPDIDAVLIATPDHWHSRISIDAMNAGKDVYCEKPMVQHVDDGPGVVEAQKKTGRIMQVGSQRVSSIVYKKAQELLNAGAIGQLNMVEAWWDRNSDSRLATSASDPCSSAIRWKLTPRRYLRRNDLAMASAASKSGAAPAAVESARKR